MSNFCSNKILCYLITTSDKPLNQNVIKGIWNHWGWFSEQSQKSLPRIISLNLIMKLLRTNVQHTFVYSNVRKSRRSFEIVEKFLTNILPLYTLCIVNVGEEMLSWECIELFKSRLLVNSFYAIFNRLITLWCLCFLDTFDKEVKISSIHLTRIYKIFNGFFYCLHLMERQARKKK